MGDQIRVGNTVFMKNLYCEGGTDVGPSLLCGKKLVELDFVDGKLKSATVKRNKAVVGIEGIIRTVTFGLFCKEVRGRRELELDAHQKRCIEMLRYGEAAEKFEACLALCFGQESDVGKLLPDVPVQNEGKAGGKNSAVERPGNESFVKALAQCNTVGSLVEILGAGGSPRMKLEDRVSNNLAILNRSRSTRALLAATLRKILLSAGGGAPVTCAEFMNVFVYHGLSDLNCHQLLKGKPQLISEIARNVESYDSGDVTALICTGFLVGNDRDAWERVKAAAPSLAEVAFVIGSRNPAGIGSAAEAKLVARLIKAGNRAGIFGALMSEVQHYRERVESGIQRHVQASRKGSASANTASDAEKLRQLHALRARVIEFGAAVRGERARLNFQYPEDSQADAHEPHVENDPFGWSAQQSWGRTTGQPASQYGYGTRPSGLNH